MDTEGGTIMNAIEDLCLNDDGWRMRTDAGMMNDDGRVMPTICNLISVHIGAIRPAEADCRPHRAYLMQTDGRE